SGVGEGSPADDLKRVKEAIIFAFNHQTVPRALVEERMKGNGAPIEVSTVYRARTEELSLPGVRVNSEKSHAAGTQYPIEITLQETPQGVHCKIRFPLNGWEERLAHVIGQDLPRAIRRLVGLSVSDSVLTDLPQGPSIEAVRAATDFRLIHGIIRETWEAELKAPVDPETPFFALGGESMSAIAICSELERRLGYEVELARMFENPSVHSLASKLQKEGRLKTHGSLVQLRAGRGHPILVIPGRFPSPYELIALARALPGHRPVFFSNVLELPSFKQEEPTVEELAADLLDDLKVLTDWERTSIIGISMGGIIGYELLSRMPDVPSSCSRLVMTDTDSPASLRDRNSVAEISRILLTGPTQFWWVQKLRRRFRKKWMSRAQRKLARIARSALNRLPLIHLEHSDPAYEYWKQERLFTRKFDRILGRYTIRPARSRVTMLLAKNEVTRPASLVDSWRDASGDKIDLLWYPGRKNVNTRNEPARSVILAHLGNALALNEGLEG
ncbi:MAG: phosphopantetheine-binding protein, partial [Rhodothermales bacterium]